MSLIKFDHTIKKIKRINLATLVETNSLTLLAYSGEKSSKGLKSLSVADPDLEAHDGDPMSDIEKSTKNL